MTKKEELVILCNQLLTHAKELQETVHVADSLTRLKECKILHRQIEFMFDRVHNCLALDYKHQTGTRAVRNVWDRIATLSTNPIND